MWFTKALFCTLLVCVSAWLVNLEPAFGHSKAITSCKGNIVYKSAKKSQKDAVYASTGLYAEHYDTNGDGKTDVMTLSHLDPSGKSHQANPLFWMVDLDHDGEPDKVYIDKGGLGKCEDIVLYEDLNVAKHRDNQDAADQGRRT